VPDPADDRPLPGEDSRLHRIGVMLLNGYGYNWYRLDNQMRADDLLVRSRASEHLESAAARLVGGNIDPARRDPCGNAVAPPIEPRRRAAVPSARP